MLHGTASAQSPLNTKKGPAQLNCFLAVCGRYIKDEDLEFFKDRVEREVDLGGGKWQHLMDKSFKDMRYNAWRRQLAVRL